MINAIAIKKFDMFGVWCFLLYPGTLGLGWILAGFLPPLSPNDAAEITTSIFHDNHTRILFSMVILMFAAMFLIPLTGIITKYIYRAEQSVGVMTVSQILGGFSLVLFTFFPAMFWIGAAFRVDRMPELVQVINDISWIMLVGGFTIYIPALYSIAAIAFCDKSERPVFPRWIGYYNCWTIILFLPGQLLYFFKVGPFAWDGIISFWVPITVFSGWFWSMFYVLRRAVKEDR